MRQIPWLTFSARGKLPLLATACLLAACGAEQSSTPNSPQLLASTASNYTDWPNIPSSIGKDPAIESRIAQILASMSLAQKIGPNDATGDQIDYAGGSDAIQHRLGAEWRRLVAK